MAIFKVGKDDVGYSGDCDCAGDCDGAVDCGHCRPMLVVAKMMAKVILVVNSNTCYLCQKFLGNRMTFILHLFYVTIYKLIVILKKI